MTNVLGGRQSGKSVMAEKMIAEYLKCNPEATIIRYRKGNAIVEKPVKQAAIKKIEAKP